MQEKMIEPLPESAREVDFELFAKKVLSVKIKQNEKRLKKDNASHNKKEDNFLSG